MVPLGKTVELCCQVVGVPKPDVEWYHNGERIGTRRLPSVNKRSGHYSENSDVIIDEGGKWKEVNNEWNSTLRVTNVGSEDTGSYVCNATNRLGSYLSSPAYIKILGEF